MIIPPFLEKGDKIAIVSPATTVKTEYIDNAVEVLSQVGFAVEVMPHAKGISGSYSGTLAERLADIKAAFDDSEVKAILCARGGYGTVHLLEYFTKEYLQAHAKWVIGFSDITALHSMMVSSGVVSLHALMCKHLSELGADDECSRYLFDILLGKLPEYEVQSHPFNHYGEAEGQIVGGNMAVMCALIGSDNCHLKPGTILFIEDICEPVYKIERMLYQLKLSGLLGNIKGLIVGQFTECRRDDRNDEDMYDMIHRMTAEYEMPIAFNFPVGHVDSNYPLIEGMKVKLSVNSEKTRLVFIS